MGHEEMKIKQLWWEQVFSAETARRFPRLAMINWFEWLKYEPEARAEVDWTVTRDPAIVEGFRASLPDYLRFGNNVRLCN